MCKYVFVYNLDGNEWLDSFPNHLYAATVFTATVFTTFTCLLNVFIDLQSGCCKPPSDCNFTYVKPTEWNATGVQNTNSDCNAWNNEPTVLCFNCESCKAGLLDNIKSNWKKVAIVNVIFLVFLIVVYSVGCCAFRNNRKDNAYWNRS